MVDRREIFLKAIEKDLYTLLRYSSSALYEQLGESFVLKDEELSTLQYWASCAQRKSSESFYQEYHAQASLPLQSLFATLNHRENKDQKETQQLYEKLLAGKRVAIVGAATIDPENEYGAEIDSYDLVVRLNFHWPVKPSEQLYRGSKADILYHCCNGDYPVQQLFSPEFKKLSFVCWEKNAESLFLERECLRFCIPSLDITPTISRLWERLESPPNTGFSAIIHLLSFSLRELFITGFTFLDHDYAPDTTSNAAQGIPWLHCGKKQIEYLASTVSNDSRVRFDKRLSLIVSAEN